ncbi:MAG: hypothetical protein ABSF03_12785 [Streptosporangiaceae bacterium]
MTFELAMAQVSAASGVPPPSNFRLTGAPGGPDRSAAGAPEERPAG